MVLGDIIYKYRHSFTPKISLRDFAKRCDLSHTYISALEKNIDPRTGKPITPTLDAVVHISRGMNMTLDELLKMLDDKQEFNLKEDSLSFNNNSAVVLVYGNIPAGIPMEMIEDVIDTEEIPADMLKGGKQYFGLLIKGNSMYPEYREGDIIILEKIDDCENGDECVVMVNGNEGTFKKVLKNENGIILQPLNPEYQPMVYTNEQIENLPVKIIGKVVEMRRKKNNK